MPNKKLPQTFKHTAVPLKEAGYITQKEFQKANNKIDRIKKARNRIEEIQQISNLLLTHKVKFDGGWLPLVKITSLSQVEQTLTHYEQIRTGDLSPTNDITFITGDIAATYTNHPLEIPEFTDWHFENVELLSANAAREFAKFAGNIGFGEITYIQDGIIPLIAPHPAQLDLPRLKKISDPDCEALATYPRTGIDLSQTTEISTWGCEQLIQGATTNNWETIKLGTTTMTDPLAELCLKFPGHIHLTNINYKTLTHHQKITLNQTRSQIHLGPRNTDIHHLFEQERKTYN